MKVLVCGGRDFKDSATLFQVLDQFHREHGFTFLVHGDARGADRLAGEWAKEQGVPFKAYPVEHDLDGEWPGAGPRRNRRMYDDAKPDMVVAFPGGKGTAGMVAYATKQQCPHIKRLYS